MRKILWWLLLLAAPAAAQNFTIVSATVVDPNGIPYANGTVSALLITNGVTPLLNGNPFSGSSGPANLSSTGSFTMQLASNTAIVPSTLKWQFTVCSAAGTVNPAIGTGPQCFTTLITISGATQNLSATLSALAPALTIPVAGTATGVSNAGQTIVLNSTGITMTCPGTLGCTIADGAGDVATIGPSGSGVFMTDAQGDVVTLNGVVSPVIDIQGVSGGQIVIQSLGSAGSIEMESAGTGAEAIQLRTSGVNGQIGVQGTQFSDNAATPEIITAQGTFNIASGTPPFVISSNTNVPNLNASLLNGATFAAPGPIGSTTPATSIVSNQYSLGPVNRAFTFNTSPTISSGFGTGAVISNANGTKAFLVNVGTGGTASSGVIGLPAAADQWICMFSDFTNPGTNEPRQSAFSTTTVTVTNYSLAGAVTAWPASEVIQAICDAT